MKLIILFIFKIFQIFVSKYSIIMQNFIYPFSSLFLKIIEVIKLIFIFSQALDLCFLFIVNAIYLFAQFYPLIFLFSLLAICDCCCWAYWKVSWGCYFP